MEQMTFDQMMKRLQEIVTLLERNEAPLETSLELFEEGLKLLNQCESSLVGFESRVTQLMNDYSKGKNDHESSL
ncbi:MAG TPA: exodeoxyribonuclease VII small subunit [Erysipelotrichaceae bacterium]|nr:exodeoxyribonuclease VII small subunit [Erysipelotrichaceae bacterium]